MLAVETSKSSASSSACTPSVAAVADVIVDASRREEAAAAAASSEADGTIDMLLSSKVMDLVKCLYLTRRLQSHAAEIAELVQSSARSAGLGHRELRR